MRFARVSHFIRMFEFLAELARRNVIRVALLYLTCCWVVLEPIHVVFHMLEVPKLVNELVLVVMALGLPVVLVLTWLFELTPSGIRPTVLVDRAQSIRAQTGRRLDRTIIVILTLALIYLTFDKFWLSRRESSPAVPVRAAVAPATPAAAPPAAPAPVSAATQVAAVAAQAPSVAPTPAASIPSAAGAQAADTGPGAIVTILEGSALFTRGSSRFLVATGVKLAAGDILATGADGLVQVELEDGTQSCSDR